MAQPQCSFQCFKWDFLKGPTCWEPDSPQQALSFLFFRLGQPGQGLPLGASCLFCCYLPRGTHRKKALSEVENVWMLFGPQTPKNPVAGILSKQLFLECP